MYQAVIDRARWIVAAALALGVVTTVPRAFAAAQPDPFAASAVGKNLPDEKISATEAERRAQIAWERGDSNWAVYYYVLAIKHGAPRAPTFVRIGEIEAASIAGFADSSYLARMFRRYLGASPKQLCADGSAALEAAEP